MRPMNRMPTAKALEYRQRLSKQTADKKAGKPLNGYPEERLIDEVYRNPEPHIHIFEVPCYLPTTNEQLNLSGRMTYSRKLRRMISMKFLLKQWKDQAANNVRSSLARHVPQMCFDQDAESRRVGRAKKLRDSINILVLSRICPKLPDDDGHVGSVKGVRDVICAWIAEGVFVTGKMGSHDERLIQSPNRPGNRIVIIDKDVIIRPPLTHKEVRDALPREVLAEMKARGEKVRALAGKFGVQIELHLKEDFSI